MSTERTAPTRTPRMSFACPMCGQPLTEIRYPSDSMLNRDQWESQQAGDLYCTCHNNHRGNKPYAYFWKSEFSSVAVRPATNCSHGKMLIEPCPECGREPLDVDGDQIVNQRATDAERDAAYKVFRENYGESHVRPLRANIKHNKTEYALPSGEHKGSNLRAFFGVPDTKDLYYESDEGDDILIEADKLYFVEDRDKFYSISQKINQS